MRSARVAHVGAAPALRDVQVRTRRLRPPLPPPRACARLQPVLITGHRTWRLPSGPPMHAENGFWRIAADGAINAVYSQATGIAEHTVGTYDAATRRVELRRQGLLNATKARAPAARASPALSPRERCSSPGPLAAPRPAGDGGSARVHPVRGRLDALLRGEHGHHGPAAAGAPARAAPAGAGGEFVIGTVRLVGGRAATAQRAPHA